MKIDDRIINYEIQQQMSKSSAGVRDTADKQPDVKKAAEQSQSKQPDTIVNLSDASKEAQQIKTIIAAEPDIRTDMVNAVKSDIDSGKYKINATAVADRLVNAFLEEII